MNRHDEMALFSIVSSVLPGVNTSDGVEPAWNAVMEASWKAISCSLASSLGIGG
jgi:hypothetical protein